MAVGHPCVPPPPCWLKKCALPLDFRAKTPQDARHFGGVLSAVMPTTASRVWLKKRTRHKNPPAIFGGPRPGKASEGHPQQVVIVVIVIIPVMFAS